MGAASQFLRRTTAGYSHWCPGCEEMHHIWVFKPTDKGAMWTFDGNVVSPTFGPSIHIIVNPKDDPDYQSDLPTEVCHYFLKAGVIEYLGDCTHPMAGRTMPLPMLPEGLRS